MVDPGLIDQAMLYYSRANNCPWHIVVNDVDIEDVLDYFIVVQEDEERKKEKKFDEAFAAL